MQVECRRVIVAFLAGMAALSGPTGAMSPDPPRMKTIGVVGGIGPQATMDFETRVHRAAQRRIPPRANGGYPPMVVLYHRRPPILLRADGSPEVPIRPDPELIDRVRRLGTMVDFLVITSNGAHMIAGEIEKASGRKVLSMVDVTLDEVRKRRWKKVGVLGMGEPTVYMKRLDALRIRYATLPPGDRARLDDAVLRLMEGREDAADRHVARNAVEKLRRESVDGVILGCSELPLLLGEVADQPDLLNPSQLLAEAAVEHAIRGIDRPADSR
jgi:aspartate racemase